ncbi:MAG: efflux RND transporter periplasmic adaptor subunit [Bacteroidetes bacterium]|nr:efflux RND transporter periplasmic adaptor subunit [Bacteroidota bacterium]
MKKEFIYAALPFILGACGNKQEETAGNIPVNSNTDEVNLSKEQRNLAGITINNPAKRIISREIRLNGFLEAPPGNVISIFAPYGGYVRSTPLLQGMHIHKGDEIASIEHQDYVQLQQDYLEVKNKLNFAQTEFERQKQLFSGEASSRKKLDEAQTDLNALHIHLNALSEKLDFCGINPEGLTATNIKRNITLHSPVNAFVKSVNINRGKFVSGQDVVAELIDTDHLHVELKAFEKDYPFIKKGASIKFSTTGSENNVYSAHVYLVGKAIGDDRSITIHGHLDNESADFTPGQSVVAYISTGSDSLLSIESSAVFSQDGKEFVFEELPNGLFNMTEVEVIESDGKYSAIAGNKLSESSRIVVSGVMSLRGMLFNTEEE